MLRCPYCCKEISLEPGDMSQEQIQRLLKGNCPHCDRHIFNIPSPEELAEAEKKRKRQERRAAIRFTVVLFIIIAVGILFFVFKPSKYTDENGVIYNVYKSYAEVRGASKDAAEINIPNEIRLNEDKEAVPVKNIRAGAFNKYKNLRVVILNENLEKICRNALINCEVLEAVYIPGEKTEIEKKALKKGNPRLTVIVKENTPAYDYCKAESLEKMVIRSNTEERNIIDHSRYSANKVVLEPIAAGKTRLLFTNHDSNADGTAVTSPGTIISGEINDADLVVISEADFRVDPLSTTGTILDTALLVPTTITDGEEYSLMTLEDYDTGSEYTELNELLKSMDGKEDWPVIQASIWIYTSNADITTVNYYLEINGSREITDFEYNKAIKYVNGGT